MLKTSFCSSCTSLNESCVNFSDFINSMRQNLIKKLKKNADMQENLKKSFRNTLLLRTFLTLNSIIKMLYKNIFGCILVQVQIL